MQCTLLRAASRRVSTILLTLQSQQANLFSFRTPYWWNKFIGATKSNRHLIKQTDLDIHSFGRGDDSLWRTHLTPGPVHSGKGLKELYISITPQYYRTQEQYEYMKTHSIPNFCHHPIYVGFYPIFCLDSNIFNEACGLLHHENFVPLHASSWSLPIDSRWKYGDGRRG